VRTAGFVVGALGVAGAGAFVAFGLLARQRYDDLLVVCRNQPCPYWRESDIQTGEQYQLFANISLGVGAAGLLAGIIMIAAGGPTAESAPTAPVTTRRGGSSGCVVRSSLALVLGCALASGCLLEWDRLRATDGGRPMPDTVVEDSAAPEDTEPPPDTRVPPEDTVLVDTGVDAGVDSRVDTGPELPPPDTTVPDTMVPVDTIVPMDTRVPDTAVPDSAMDSRVDTTVPDTTPLDTFVRPDTTPADTGPPDAGDCFRGICRCSAMNPTGWCMVGEGCSGGACVRLPGGVVGALVVTEVMSDPTIPTGATSSSPEWFEVYNPGMTPVNLQGLRVNDNAGSYTVPAAMILPGRAYAVFASTMDPALNAGLPNITVVYSTAIQLANTADRVVLDLGTSTSEIDRVEYTSTGWPNMRGRAKTLNPASLNAMDNNTGSNWCNGARMYGTEMNFGSPGEVNTCP
jgi:hypothetical protein